ncbi:subtilisin family serine protease [Povalibacter uvarum]|uniref:Subtilisin family serine protease n=1 Tax=Povalibacter uvarum TaxID=732238 RepID=A0A841HNP5_9GAMM|nr:S8 family serine peptidase [Povalibacter uvarum]MBB6093768.1 subtilisin family serine protease [Povalibacter uvarum]
MRRTKRLRVLSLAVTAVIVSACGSGSNDSMSPSAKGPATTLGKPNTTAAPAGITTEKIDRRLATASGPVEVWVSMDTPSIAAQKSAIAASAGLRKAKLLPSTSKASVADAMEKGRSTLRSQQEKVALSLASVGAEELGRVQVAHNAIAVRVDASQLPQIASIAGVAAVRPVINYELDLSETVPYVGATAVQATGVDGTGVTVAVLDSGIDYTHRNLGGPGTLEAYAAAYGVNPGDAAQTTLDGLFPTAKVVGGFDFVGEAWPNGARSEDPDPIDFQGHGTHVADIIGGKSQDGTHVGVAPGSKLLAVKVCSAVATSCNGVALLLAVDFALDPNRDGDLDDAADIIHLSLGSDYGMIEDDLTAALEDAVDLGSMVVASAGNGSNKPYVVGSPSIGPGVLSVAQTQVPSAQAIPLVINAPASIAGVYGNTATVEWAPVGAGVTGDVVFIGRGCPAGSVAAGSPADPILANPTGKIALIDRGGCSVSLKVDYAVDAGATGVIIGLVAAGDAVSFSFGGGDSFAPTLVIQQVLSNAIKARLNAAQVVNASISPASSIPLVGSMASTSSRGPSALQTIKPEIGAPGASTSAEVGTGDGATPFGGTSGAAPMVSGAAALLLQAYPDRCPFQVKAMLMNSAETTVYTNPALLPGGLAPITRIGAGELRVNKAIGLKAIAWNDETESSALSFGFVDASGDNITITKRVEVQNFSNATRTYSIARSFRYADDEASGAVTVHAPGSVTVGPKGYAWFNVQVSIKGSKLPAWGAINGGANGGNGALLNGPEFDGYITLTSGSEKLSLPWHVLPRKSSAMDAKSLTTNKNGTSVDIRNNGVNDGEFELFSLTGTSPKVPASELPQPGDNFAVIDLKQVGVRHLPAAVYGADYLEFAISTYGKRVHPNYPAEFDIYIDSNNDGVEDYVVYNTENGGFSVTGQNLVYVANLTTGVATAVFYTDADLVSGNVIFTVPMNSTAGAVNVGVQPGTTFGFSVYAFDNYLTGNLTDLVEGMLFTPATPRFSFGAEPWGTAHAGTITNVPVTTATVADANSTESGVLLMYRRNAYNESQAVKAK